MTSAILALLLLFQNAPYVPPGAVEGILKGVDGKPVANVRMAAIAVPKGNGTPDDNLNYFDLNPPTNTTLTEDDGHFIMADLGPGRYYLMAGVPGQGTYYPGTTDLRKATIVTVTSNGLSGDLNFGMLQQFGARLSGGVKADMSTLGARTATLIGGGLEDIIQVDVKPDGSYDFGVVPPGSYLVSMHPTTAGIASVRVNVGTTDVSSVELVPLPTQNVSGRIVTKKGPLPVGFLGFSTEKTYVDATINPDGTFTAPLHAATHVVDYAGLPIGYTVASVRIGSKDVSKGIVVDKSDITDVVITLDTPEKLASIRGKITGLDASRYASTKVEITGPVTIIGSLQTSIRADGSFDFPAVAPGTYHLKLIGIPEFAPMDLNLDSTDTINVSVVVPGK